MRASTGAAFEIDGGALGAQVKADGLQPEELLEHGGEQVLAGVLLHVVEAARPIDGAVHRPAAPSGAARRWAMRSSSSTTSSTATPAIDPRSNGCPPEVGIESGAVEVDGAAVGGAVDDAGA